ncbi:Alcohol dehydrogenase transcription factor Myb/SANT-like [Popillia japonica]|uniref:Alcohol dehydrogenase transcription factor Myb/SANT-like n=1 Tax=Popillia japonica TaxID=7064 RepID=A0AAW1JC49_POPJA
MEKSDFPSKLLSSKGSPIAKDVYIDDLPLPSSIFSSVTEDYHNSPELWNNKITEYKDTRIKNDKLKDLASKYKYDVIEVEKKMKNLRSAFHRE